MIIYITALTEILVSGFYNHEFVHYAHCIEQKGAEIILTDLTAPISLPNGEKMPPERLDVNRNREAPLPVIASPGRAIGL